MHIFVTHIHGEKLWTAAYAAFEPRVLSATMIQSAGVTEGGAGAGKHSATRMRKPRWYVRRWRSINELREETVLQALADPKAQALSPDFFKTLRERRDALARDWLKLGSIQIPIFAFLVFSLIPIDVNFSLFGISPAANRSLREVLVVVSSILALFSGFLGLHDAILKDILKAYSRKLSKGHSRVQEILQIGIGIEHLMMPDIPTGYGKIGRAYSVLMVCLAVALILLVIIAVVAALVIHFLILRNIYADPTFSRGASLCVIAFVVLSDGVAVFIALLQAGFIPIHDYSRLRAMAEMTEGEPDRAKRVYAHIVREHRNRSWLARTFGRPKLPDDFSTIN